MSPSGSTRWCPTPEQLMILEEMYRGGVRTPNASKIQKITAHLSFYGKIEGKNVFYWFQNRKARERQMLRRKLSKQLYQQQLLQEQLHLHQYHDHHYHQNSFLRVSNSESPPPAMHPFDKSVHCLPQGGAEAASTQQMKINSKWKTDSPIANMCEMQPSGTTRSYWDDWTTTRMMIRDGGHDNLFPCCSHNKPLKTLQLFPIKTPCSAVKDQPTLN